MFERKGARNLVKASAAVLGVAALAGCGNNETQAVDLPDNLIAEASSLVQENLSHSFVAQWDTDTPEAARVIIYCGKDGQPKMDLRTQVADGSFDQLETDDKVLAAELPEVCADGTIAGPWEAAAALRIALDEKRLYDETR